MANQRGKEGYLMVDHRASPGLTAEEARQAGLPPSAAGEGQFFEAPTVTCIHCGVSYMVNPDRKRPQEFCRKCYAYQCDICAKLPCPGPYKKLADLLNSDDQNKVNNATLILLSR